MATLGGGGGGGGGDSPKCGDFFLKFEAKL